VGIVEPKLAEHHAADEKQILRFALDDTVVSEIVAGRQSSGLLERRIMVLLLLESNGATMDSAITVKGQATIPKAIREYLGLKPRGPGEVLYAP